MAVVHRHSFDDEHLTRPRLKWEEIEWRDRGDAVWLDTSVVGRMTMMRVVAGAGAGGRAGATIFRLNK